MITERQLKEVLHTEARSQSECVLLILAVDDACAKSVATIRSLGSKSGVRRIKDWNLSHVLAKAAPRIIKTPSGWELTRTGKQRVQSLLAATSENAVVAVTSHSLRQQLVTIRSPDSASFVEEAIICFEARQFRAAAVFAWIGAVSVLHHHVTVHRLLDFNAEASRRNAKWRVAKLKDDLGRMGEHDFLDVIEAIGVIGKNVKLTLQNHCLQLRNGCGHPNSLHVAEHTVAAHIETLILNVFSKF